MNILKLRKLRGLSQQDLSILLNVRQSTISSWENGKRFPRKEMLGKLTTLFNCTIDELL